MSDQEIVEMVLFPVVNEACRVLDEGVVIRASDLDVSSIVGMSFPSYRSVSLTEIFVGFFLQIKLTVIVSVFIISGGIVFWADTVGPRHVYESLNKWTALYGNFFKPSRYLEQRVANGIPLVRTEKL